MERPSIILMGSKPAAVVTLAMLLERGWNVKAVVVARNFDLSWYGGTSLDQLASDNGIPVYSQAELPRSLRADYVVSYQFRNLVRADVLRMADVAALNFHAAPLPRFGGFAYYSVAILEDVKEYGVSCHHMDVEFDTGPLVKVRPFPIDARQETAYSLEAKAQQEMLYLFADICHAAESGLPLPSMTQKKEEMRYLNRQEFETMKNIPDGADAETIDRYARAFWYPPFECAKLVHNGVAVEIVPAIARPGLGRALHAGDFDRLMAGAMAYQSKGLVA